MIKRTAAKKLIDIAAKFKCVAVTGARQTGKTTLVKTIFKTKPYISLENIQSRKFALEDPVGFLAMYPNGAVLDEVQRAPELFSYLQEILDNSKKKGLFILTGSNNFLLQENISQTLAGRIGFLQLMPFSISELDDADLTPEDDDELMFNGFYPPVYDQHIPAEDWCPNYIRTYIERDVRQIKNITDLIAFEKFLRLIAGRTGQELNASALSVEAGIEVKTVQSWIGILENSFLIFLLRPHHKNFKKTVIKRPKIYFYDTSLVCSLLGINNVNQLKNHPIRAALFETLVVSELVKKRTNAGLPVNIFYWRDKTGHEVDVIVDNAGKLIPIEIKSGKSINNEFFKNLHYWKKLSKEKNGFLLYAGRMEQKRSDGTEIINWRKISGRNI